MSLEEAFAPAEAAYRNAVMASTWGHLAPKPKKKYTFDITYCIAAYGHNCTIIDADMSADDSPWLYEAMFDFVFETGREIEHGKIYRIKGTFTVSKTGKYTWKEDKT